MNSKRNWFSYLTWGILIILTGALYYFSFHELMDNSGLIDKKYVNLVLIMSAVIISEAFIILSHAISRHDIYIGNAIKTVFGIVSFVVSFGVYIAARLYSFIAMRSSMEAGVDLSLCDRALIKDNMKIFVDLSNKEGITDTFISCFFKFLGNKATAVIVANLVISFVTAIILFFAVKMLAGYYEACVVILIAGILPEFTSLITVYNLTGTDLLFLAVGLFFIGLIKQTEDNRIVNEIIILLSSAIVGLLCLYNGVFYCLIPLILVLLIDNIYAGLVFRIINPILALIIITGFFVIPSNMNYLLSGDTQGFANGIVSLIGYRFAIAPSLEVLLSLAKAPLMIVPAIVVLTFITNYPKKEYDRIHAVTCALIVNLAALYLLSSKDLESYTVFTIVFMAIIGGAGIAKLFEFGTDLVASDEELYAVPQKATAAAENSEKAGIEEVAETADTAETSVSEESKLSDELLDLDNEEIPEEVPVAETAAEPVASSEPEPVKEPETNPEPGTASEAEAVTEPETASKAEAVTEPEAAMEAEDVTEAVQAEDVAESKPASESVASESVESTPRFSEQEEGEEALSTMDYEEPVLPSVSSILGKSPEEEKQTEVPEQFDNPLPLPKPSKRARKAKKEIVIETEEFDDNYDFDDIPDDMMKYDIDF